MAMPHDPRSCVGPLKAKKAADEDQFGRSWP
jgi:hypothetical protein